MKKLFKSFGFAAKGISIAFKEQQNLRIHAVVVVIVIALGFFLRLTKVEWAIITLTIGFVISAELLNTAIEELVNLVSPGHHQLAGKIKDISAGAVLLAAVAAVIVGVVILGSKIFVLLV